MLLRDRPGGDSGRRVLGIRSAQVERLTSKSCAVSWGSAGLTENASPGIRLPSFSAAFGFLPGRHLLKMFISF